MFSQFLLLFLGFVLVGPQVALAAFRFNFSPSPIEECAPVTVSFTGNIHNNSLPQTLTVLPFNSTPISIPIPNATVNSTGVGVSFLPMISGTEFIASLDMTNGINVAKVSDIFNIDTTNGNTSCVPAPQTPPYILPTSVSQCAPFNVTFTTASVPNLRLMEPNNSAILMHAIPSTPSGVATFIMNAPRSQEVLLVAYDSVTNDITKGWTSLMLTVGGDASSDASCLPIKNNGNNMNMNMAENNEGSNHPLSTGALVGITIGAMVAVAIFAVFGIYLFRAHRRKMERRRGKEISFNPSMLEKSSTFHKSDYYSYNNLSPTASKPPFSAGFSPGFVKSPPYTTERFSGVSTNFLQQSSAQPGSEIGSTGHGEIIAGGADLYRSASEKAVSSINAYDVEKMLEYAASGGLTPPSTSALSLLGRDTSAANELNPFGDNGPLRDSPEPLRRGSGTSYASNFEIVTRPPIAKLSIGSPSLLPSSPLAKGSMKPVVREQNDSPVSTRSRSRFSDASTIESVRSGASGVGGFPRPTYTYGETNRDSVSSWGDDTRL